MTVAAHPTFEWARRPFGFRGRSSRGEYWFNFLVIFPFALGAVAFFVLVAGLIVSEFMAFDARTLFLPDANAVYWAGLFFANSLMIPTTARRFHDCGYGAGWFRLTAKLNMVGGVALAGSLILAIAAKDPAYVFGSAPWHWLAFVSLCVPYISFCISFWIGFIRPEPGPNKYGPNPIEAAV